MHTTSLISSSPLLTVEINGLILLFASNPLQELLGQLKFLLIVISSNLITTNNDAFCRTPMVDSGTLNTDHSTFHYLEMETFHQPNQTHINRGNGHQICLATM